MSRQSKDIDLILFKEQKIKIGEQEVILTCSDEDGDPNKLPVKEFYVDAMTGNLVIIYDDRT
jgi:hypothetical protein